jgi:uncharacterized protein YlzI (FlbEa/FlbD family)
MNTRIVTNNYIRLELINRQVIWINKTLVESVQKTGDTCLINMFSGKSYSASESVEVVLEKIR